MMHFMKCTDMGEINMVILPFAVRPESFQPPDCTHSIPVCLALAEFSNRFTLLSIF